MAARRWLSRNAAGVRLLIAQEYLHATACIRLLHQLPALEEAELHPSRLRVPNDLSQLLEALSCCHRLRSLDLGLIDMEEEWWCDLVSPVGHGSMPDVRMRSSLGPFAKLRSLTKLSLWFGEAEFYPLPNVVGALVSLTGLVELTIGFPQPAVVPAALGRLTGLRSLEFDSLVSCVLEAGCLDLPNLLSLNFCECDMSSDAEVLARVPVLPSLTSIEFCDGSGPPFVAQLAQLPRLQRMVFETAEPSWAGGTFAHCPYAYVGLPRLPADMGSQGALLRHLCVTGHRLTHFPPILTQLVALEHLDASGQCFAEVPAAITALSRLTELVLGGVRYFPPSTPPLDARALGDLSGFPRLRILSLRDCTVTLCALVLGVARHASLIRLEFRRACPAPGCAPMVLQLSQVLERLRRCSVLCFSGESD